MAIYDCFMFFNEIDLLKIRLKLLNDYVDYFVLVEINKTQNGDIKRLYFKENESLFEDYRDKIIYVNPEYVPDCSGENDWTIEHYQRNCILKGIERCKEDDLIMISDIDEIPNPVIFENLVNVHFWRKDISFWGNIKRSSYGIANSKNRSYSNIQFRRKMKINDILQAHPFVLKQELYYYFLNYKCTKSWYGTIISRFGNMSMPQTLRESINLLPYIENGGWHFSYLGGIEKIKNKVESIVEGNVMIREIESTGNLDEYIRKCIENGTDIYKRTDYVFNRESVDDCTFPGIREIKIEMPYLFYEV